MAERKMGPTTLTIEKTAAPQQAQSLSSDSELMHRPIGLIRVSHSRLSRLPLAEILRFGRTKFFAGGIVASLAGFGSLVGCSPRSLVERDPAADQAIEATGIESNDRTRPPSTWYNGTPRDQSDGVDGEFGRDSDFVSASSSQDGMPQGGMPPNFGESGGGEAKPNPAARNGNGLARFDNYGPVETGGPISAPPMTRDPSQRRPLSEDLNRAMSTAADQPDFGSETIKVPNPDSSAAALPKPDSTQPNLTQSNLTQSNLTQSNSPQPAAELRTAGHVPLRSATPQQLLQIIADADADTRQMIANADPTRTPAENRQRLIDTIALKRDAAVTLTDSAAAAATEQLAGRRAALQSLSGLASLSVAQARTLLPTEAREATDSGLLPLQIDGHNVLASVAVQGLVAGQNGAAEAIVDNSVAIENKLLAAATESVSVQTFADSMSTLVSLGRGRSVLADYGEDLAAGRVRETILKLYANSPEPKIAKLADEMAGDLVYRNKDQMLQQILNGESIPVQQWREAVETLIDSAPDLQTVQYLAPAALELESVGKMEHAAAIYEVLQQRFAGRPSAMADEVQIAVTAANNRQSMIGQKFQPTPKSIDDLPITLTDYRGRIVLMPFWAKRNPQSIAIIADLLKIQTIAPDRIAVVGMNLDLTESDVQSAAAEDPATSAIRSFLGSATDKTAEPIAVRFGMVALPFVVVIDPSGTIDSMGYRPAAIKRSVSQLLKRDFGE